MILPPLSSQFEDSEYFSAPVSYEWDEWQVKKYFYWAKDHDFQKLQFLTPAARIAFALGAAEWIVRRFDDFTDTNLATEYLESCWMATVDLKFGQFIPFNWTEWRGPYEAPQLIACGVASTALFERQDEPDPAWAACYGLNLARHVLPDVGPFDSWFESSFLRMNKHHGLDVEPLKDDILAEQFDDGRVVSRSVFHPNAVYSIDLAETEMRQFVDARAGNNKFTQTAASVSST